MRNILVISPTPQIRIMTGIIWLRTKNSIFLFKSLGPQSQENCMIYM